VPDGAGGRRHRCPCRGSRLAGVLPGRGTAPRRLLPPGGLRCSPRAAPASSQHGSCTQMHTHKYAHTQAHTCARTRVHREAAGAGQAPRVSPHSPSAGDPQLWPSPARGFVYLAVVYSFFCLLCFSRVMSTQCPHKPDVPCSGIYRPLQPTQPCEELPAPSPSPQDWQPRQLQQPQPPCRGAAPVARRVWDPPHQEPLCTGAGEQG